MRGALLRSEQIENLDALGEVGTPVYRVAIQLRDAVRRKSPDLVAHLAIPQINQAGDRIDWYAPTPGPVIPWSASTEDERIPARTQMEALMAGLRTVSARLLASNTETPDSDATLFAKLLNRVPYFPDESYIYLVDGLPVVTFWGFDHIESDRKRNPLLCLYPPPPAPVPAAPPLVAPPLMTPSPEAPLATTVVVADSPWWRLWWWLLLLPLLLVLLLGLRACTPTGFLPSLGSSGWPSWLPFTTPTHRLPTTQAPVSNATGVSDPNLLLPNRVLPPLSDTHPSNLAPSQPPPDVAVPDTTLPAQDVNPPPLPDTTTDDTSPDPLANKPQAPEDDAVLLPPPLDAAAPLATGTPPLDALSLPPNLSNGPANFLNGRWRAGAGIQDTQTGKPLRLEYQFQDGQGQVTVTRGNASCQGPVSAAMQSGALQITPDGQAHCSDGGQYELPEILCKPGATTSADCTGNYGNMQFPLNMRQAKN
ncbi:SrfA family protein [Castellaniella sp.]|uniref:SrfA family protein n=1 Tax=Castellaniella sp. TaxID=1955812 RepID=UPI003A4C6782